jgi:hypothetical protein
VGYREQHPERYAAKIAVASMMMAQQRRLLNLPDLARFAPIQSPGQTRCFDDGFSLYFRANPRLKG